VHLICGFLGVGKTTALRALAARRPPEERWAILVNEMGMVDVDGAVLNQADLGVRVETLPGGCICCTSRAPFRQAVADALRVAQPHRLFVEPTGLASPGPLLAALDEALLSEAIEVGPVITLVDPRRFLMPSMHDHPVFREQIEAADILVANRADLATAAQLEEFLVAAKALRPAKQVVATCVGGDLDPAWLDLEPRAEPLVHTVARAHAHVDGPTPQAPSADEDGVVRWAHSDELASTCGWIFPPEERFVRAILASVLGIAARPGPLLPAGALRIKGLIRLEEGAAAVHADLDGVTFESVTQARDSRLEILVAPGATPPWGTLEAALLSATRPRPR